ERLGVELVDCPDPYFFYRRSCRFLAKLPSILALEPHRLNRSHRLALREQPQDSGWNNWPQVAPQQPEKNQAGFARFCCLEPFTRDRLKRSLKGRRSQGVTAASARFVGGSGDASGVVRPFGDSRAW